MKRRTVAVISALVASACGLFPSLDDLTGGTPDVAVDSPSDASTDVANDANDASDAGSDADANPCPSLHGPSMVFVPSNGGGFCIDGTEVTTTQYADFITAVGQGAPIAGPPSGVCQWNASILPLATGSYGCTADWTNAQTHPNRAMACVDWCDAYAYCAWAGKRICGAIDGGALPYASPIGPSNQEYTACSRNGTQAYPYGSTYVKGNCNTKDLYEGGTPMIADVGSFGQCAGAFPGIHDIAGNVEEWIDSCFDNAEGGATDVCHESSDSFNYVQTQTGFSRCDLTDSDYRNLRSFDIGIRCCSP